MTWRGFLRAYARSLSGTGSLSLARLARAAAAEAPRCAEPLVLLAQLDGREAELARLARGTWLEGELERVLPLTAPFKGDPSALYACGEVPIRYMKVADAYRWAAGGAAEHERMVKGIIRERCLGLLDETGASIADAARTVGLDRANLSGFLRGGDLGRVSFDTACRVEDALRQMAREA